jgi:signal peptidase I
LRELSASPSSHPPDPGAPGDPAAPRGRGAKRRRPFWRELPVLVVVAFAVALLIKSLLVQAFFIPSASMEPTLRVGDRVLVEKVSYRFGRPDRGDVVVFEKQFGGVPPQEDDNFLRDIVDSFRGLFGFPTGGEQDFIKRVIAVGGDRVEGRDGRVYVNGEEIEEPYLPEGTQTSNFGPTDVPQGMIFVMGDNRGNSDDSRSFGPIEAEKVVGQAFVLIWPPAHFSGL